MQRKIFHQGLTLVFSSCCCTIPRFGDFWWEIRRETPLVIAIRAGQASAVEFLVQHGAPVDGGSSHGRLTAADGRAPAGAREKMMARRCVCVTQQCCQTGWKRYRGLRCPNLEAVPPLPTPLNTFRVSSSTRRVDHLQYSPAHGVPMYLYNGVYSTWVPRTSAQSLSRATTRMFAGGSNHFSSLCGKGSLRVPRF